jgi:predicted NBD/HSP70 family sugar kinase
VIAAPNLGWNNETLDLPALLPELPLGIRLFNEANAAALAELQVRPHGHADFLFVSGEVGVGGGLLIGSELFTGPSGHAGELGHVVVQPDGTACSCGGRGCLETVAGQDAIFAAAGISRAFPAVAGNAENAGQETGVSPSDPSRSESLDQLKSALLANDAAALAAVGQAGLSLGVAVASSARLFNISAVVLGGHFALLGKWIVPALNNSLAIYAPGVVREENISLSGLGQTGALRGAAGSVVRSLLEAPHRILPPATP